MCDVKQSVVASTIQFNINWSDSSPSKEWSGVACREPMGVAVRKEKRGRYSRRPQACCDTLGQAIGNDALSPGRSVSSLCSGKFVQSCVGTARRRIHPSPACHGLTDSLFLPLSCCRFSGAFFWPAAACGHGKSF